VAIDRRHRRREKSRADLLAALQRLKNGEGTHAKHIGIRVRITKEAVAREARRSPATLYRLPDVIEAINAESHSNPQKQQVPPSEARRRALVDEIEDLKRKNALLVSENFRLMRLLAKYDPKLEGSTPTELSPVRERTRLAKRPGL
jgi:hypothetical protein